MSADKIRKTIERLSQYQLLDIYWKDIYSDCRWCDKDELKKARCKNIVTSGRFYQLNKEDEILILHSIVDDGDADFTIIPIGVITKIKKRK